MLGILIFFLPLQVFGMEEKLRVAVIDISGGEGIGAELQMLVTNAVIDAIADTGKFDVIDRMNRDKILKEQGFQLTPFVDEKTRVEAGRLLGVQKIITGSLSRIDEVFFLSIQMLDVETGRVEASRMEKCYCSIPKLVETASEMAKKMVGVEGEKEEVTFKRDEKSLFIAGSLSLFAGFGSGNFYGGSPLAGGISLMGEIIGGGVLFSGFIKEERDENMIIAGGIIFGAFRAFDFVYSIIGTHRYNEKMRRRPSYSLIFHPGGITFQCEVRF